MTTKRLRWGPAGKRLIRNFTKTEEGRRTWAKTQAMFDAVSPLAAIMHDQSITHRDLAERMGVSRQRVSKMLGGGENLTVETLALAYHVLGQRLVLGCRPIQARRHG